MPPYGSFFRFSSILKYSQEKHDEGIAERFNAGCFKMQLPVLTLLFWWDRRFKSYSPHIIQFSEIAVVVQSLDREKRLSL